MTAVTCTGIRRLFGALAAVDGVDLQVDPGSRHALIGPNGAGKTTLMHLITGALRPSAGTVSVAGRDVTRLSVVARSRLGVSQTMQHASLFPTMTAAENVLLAHQRTAGRIGLRRRRHDDQVRELLDRVGLTGRAESVVTALSHGERKQLELAVALAAQPQLLLLDEPAAGMSPAETQRVAELIEALPQEVTVLFVEHDLDLVFRLASGVTVMHLGRVLLSGSPQEVRANPAVQEAYLGTARAEDLWTATAKD